VKKPGRVKQKEEHRAFETSRSNSDRATEEGDARRTRWLAKQRHKKKIKHQRKNTGSPPRHGQDAKQWTKKPKGTRSGQPSKATNRKGPRNSGQSKERSHLRHQCNLEQKKNTTSTSPPRRGKKGGKRNSPGKKPSQPQSRRPIGEESRRARKTHKRNLLQKHN